MAWHINYDDSGVDNRTNSTDYYLIERKIGTEAVTVGKIGYIRKTKMTFR